MEECAEICAVREVLALTACHVDNLDYLVEVESLEGAANVLDIVWREQVVTVLAIQTQETNMVPH